MLIKKRKAKVSERGIYIQDKELLETEFLPGVRYKYVVDTKNKIITIQPSETGNTVSKRRRSDIEMSVIDIRKQEVREIFNDADFLEIEIYENVIRIIGVKKGEQGEEITNSIVLSREEFREFIREQGIREYPTVLDEALTAVSIFSGAGVFDIGFHEEFRILRSLEIDKDAVSTYRYNFGNHIIQGDILTIDKETIPEVDIIFGGSPCQGFSNANRRTNIINNPNNLLIREFVRAVRLTKCKVFVLENVPQVLTAGDGQFIKEIKSFLSDYLITSGILNASHFGTAQNRRRAFIIGSKIGPIPLPKPSKNKRKTVGEAFKGLHDNLPQQLDYTRPTSVTLERMKHVPQGGNFMDIPERIRPKGTHSINYRRLRLDEVAPSIVHVGKSNILHPTKNRTLSVRETARLFDVPDTFVFKGALRAMQQQIANSVPVSLGRALARKVKEAFQEKLNDKGVVFSFK